MKDLIGTEYGYHCEDCFKTLNYGEEVDRHGTILCKECAKKSTFEAFKARILSAEAMDELNNIRAEYSAADLTEEDKQRLGEYTRARYGNHIQ